MEICCYCGEPRKEKIGCCGENHWEEINDDIEQKEGIMPPINDYTDCVDQRAQAQQSPLHYPIEWLDTRRDRLHAEDCTAREPSAQCSCGLHRVLSQLRQLRNDLDREAQRPGIMWVNEP